MSDWVFGYAACLVSGVALAWGVWVGVHAQLKAFQVMPDRPPGFALNEKYEFVFAMEEAVLGSGRAEELLT